MIEETPLRVLDVIDSCVTQDQVLVARKYAVLFLNKNAKIFNYSAAMLGEVFAIYLRDKYLLLGLTK